MKQEKKNATAVASENQKTELRTAFDIPRYVGVIEALLAAGRAIDVLATSYDDGDSRRDVLNGISNTITLDLMEKLGGVVGSDFVECSMNLFNKQ